MKNNTTSITVKSPQNAYIIKLKFPRKFQALSVSSILVIPLRAFSLLDFLPFCRVWIFLSPSLYSYQIIPMIIIWTLLVNFVDRANFYTVNVFNFVNFKNGNIITNVSYLVQLLFIVAGIYILCEEPVFLKYPLMFLIHFSSQVVPTDI